MAVLFFGWRNFIILAVDVGSDKQSVSLKNGPFLYVVHGLMEGLQFKLSKCRTTSEHAIHFPSQFWFSKVSDYKSVNAKHAYFWLAILDSCTWSKYKFSPIVTMQVCSCSSITQRLGDECSSSPCSKNSCHHLWAWASWHVPRLVWVFQQLPEILWPFACGSFVLST